MKRKRKLKKPWFTSDHRLPSWYKDVGTSGSFYPEMLVDLCRVAYSGLGFKEIAQCCGVRPSVLRVWIVSDGPDTVDRRPKGIPNQFTIDFRRAFYWKKRRAMRGMEDDRQWYPLHTSAHMRQSNDGSLDEETAEEERNKYELAYALIRKKQDAEDVEITD